MAFDGEHRMTTQAQAIGRAAVVKEAFARVERELQEGVDLAQAAGRPDVADKLAIALTHVKVGHARAGEAAVLIAEHYGVATVDVGGEDKPTDPPPGA